MSEEERVEQGGRIKGLESFYGSIEASIKSISIDEIPKGKKVSDEMKGQWALEQIENAARTLGVLQFIEPIKDGGQEVPVMESIMYYKSAELEADGVRIKRLRDVLPFKHQKLQIAQERLSEATKKQHSVEDKSERRGRGRPPKVKEQEEELELLPSEEKFVASGDEEYADAYRDWEHAEDAYTKVEDKLVLLVKEADKKAMSRYNSDHDATKMVTRALAALRNFVGQLFHKFDRLEEVARTIDDLKEDPFDKGDMRRVYGNILKKYRGADELGVVATIVEAMSNSQLNSHSNKSVSQWVRYTETFLIQMRRLKVSEISIGDLAALIAISGFSESQRKDFFKDESIMHLALGGEEADDFDNEDHRSTISGSSRKKPLFDRVQLFARSQADREDIMGKFGKKLQVGEDLTKKAAKEAEEKNRQVFYQKVAQGVLKKSNTCYNFASGQCKFGDKCRFEHSIPTTPDQKGSTSPSKSAVASSAPAKAGKPDEKTKKQTTKKEPDMMAVHYDSESSNCVIISEESVMSVRQGDVLGPIDTDLIWDSATSSHVAGDPRIAQTNVRQNVTGKQAHGLGGSRRIKCVADSDVMGEEDFITIEGGQTPNLLSIGKATAKDSSTRGITGMCWFTCLGAVRMKLNKDEMKVLTKIRNRARDEGRIVGEAVMEDGLYRQRFGDSASVSRMSEMDNSYHVSTSPYAGRMVVDSTENIIGILLSAGVKPVALKTGIMNGTISGLPKELTASSVDLYMQTRGLDISQLEAAAKTLPLVHPIDYEKEVIQVPGEGLVIDNIDPSFSRCVVSSSDEGEVAPNNDSPMETKKKPRKEVIRSLGGFIDCVVGHDVATGYRQVVGRKVKKHPHLILANFVKNWTIRWRSLKQVRVDDEFITEKSMSLLQDFQLEHQMKIKLLQVPPKEHNRGLGTAEGGGRWVQEVAQANMNRAKILVKRGIISEKEARSFWFHSVLLACLTENLKPSKLNPFLSRFTEGTGEDFNISIYPLLPFLTMVVGKKLLYDENGRGEAGLYLGPSMLVRGGIIFYSLTSRMVSIQYSFMARDYLPLLSDLDVERGTELLYGGLVEHCKPVSGDEIMVDVDSETDCPGSDFQEPLTDMNPALSSQVDGNLPDVDRPQDLPTDTLKVHHSDANLEDIQGSNVSSIPIIVPEDSDLPFKSSSPVRGGNIPTVDNDTGSNGSTMVSGESNIQKQKKTVRFVDSDEEELYESVKMGRERKRFSISPQVQEDVYRRTYAPRRYTRNATEYVNVSSERPQKPVVPTKQQAKRDPAWFQARIREYKKLAEENAFCAPNYNPQGVLPKGHIIMPMLEVYEFKWKQDPDSGEMRWLECVRAVVDGSKDKRDINFYAETPSKANFLLMVSVEASLGHYHLASDAVRAYLNAESMDDHLYVTLPEDVVKMGLGLLPFMKINKGVYGTRSGALSWEIWFDKQAVEKLGFQKCLLARSVYKKTGKGGVLTRLLRHSDDCRMSCENQIQLSHDCDALSRLVRMSEWKEAELFLGCEIEYGDKVVLLRLTVKIKSTGEEYEDYLKKYNPKRRTRKTGLPSGALEPNLSEDQMVLLSGKEVTHYRGIVGSLNWVSLIRMDCKFYQHIVAGRMQEPRVWDMYCVIWYLEYMVHTAEYPLVLGGPIVDPESMSDASFATLHERRSVKSHFVRASPLSGSILANVATVKIATTSVWEVEVAAASDAVDSLSYVMNVCDELEYPTEGSRKVRIDSESSLEWFDSSKVSDRSRHLQIKYYHTKHSMQEGIATGEFVNGENNEADLLTKIMGASRTRKLTRKLLGHILVLGCGYRGVIELEDGESI